MAIKFVIKVKQRLNSPNLVGVLKIGGTVTLIPNINLESVIRF